MLQLSAAVASLTLVTVVGARGLLGLGPAIVLASGALTALPAGRLMDRIGRVPVLAGGFAVGAIGCSLAALGSAVDSPVAVLIGLLGVGAGGGPALPAPAAGGGGEGRAAGRCCRGGRPATGPRRSAAVTASRWCSSAPSSARSSGRRCSAR